jgi:8-oxo-dGTP diphosphatase
MKLFVGVKVIIKNQGKVLLLREAAYGDGTNLGKWGVPGGRIESGESLDEGLAREVLEECGLSLEKGDLVGVIETFPVIRGEECHIVRLYYESTYSGGEVILSADHDVFGWFSLEEVKELELVSGEADLITKVLDMMDVIN